MSTAIPGNLHVANDVLADIVGNAAMECYGVVGMTAPNAADGIAKILPASRLRRGVVVDATDKGIHVDLYVIIEYGTNISTVSQNLVDQVSFALKEYARVPLDGVEVHVEDVKVRRELYERTAARGARCFCAAVFEGEFDSSCQPSTHPMTS